MQALRVFWAKGYQSTTLTDLQQAMGGLTAPSLYAAFGSKEALFREVVVLYHQTQGIPLMKALTEGATARASIEGLLRVAATTFCQPDTPRGCLLVLGAMNCMPESQGVQDYLRKLRLLRQKLIRQRLKRGVAEGDVPRGADLAAMAAFYAAIVNGLAIEARDVESSKALQAVVEAAMAAWDGLTSKKRA
jgi:AcrR family transcriptional regulator